MADHEDYTAQGTFNDYHFRNKSETTAPEAGIARPKTQQQFYRKSDVEVNEGASPFSAGGKLNRTQLNMTYGNASFHKKFAMTSTKSQLMVSILYECLRLILIEIDNGIIKGDV